MKLTENMTFEKVCSGYLLISLVLALLIPPDFSIESKLPLSVERIPFANYALRIPGHLNSISFYYLSMWILLPLTVAAFSARPQRNEATSRISRSFPRLIFATFVALAIFGLVCKSFYLEISDFEPSSRGVALIVLMARYKIGLGILGGVFMLTSALSVYMIFIQVPKFWYLYFTSAR